MSVANSPTNLYDALAQYLDKGDILDSFDFCCPPCGYYVLSSVETFLKFAEAVGITTGEPIAPECAISIRATVETYLKLAEAVDISTIPQADNNFDQCFTDLSNSVDDIEPILDKGIVEWGEPALYGGAGICALVGFLSSYEPALSPSEYADVVNLILDKGIVIHCESTPEEDRIVLASVETFLKYSEAVGL